MASTQDEDFLFGWSDHADNFAISFGEFLNQKELIDVTLFADGEFFPAHRLVLSASSPYFRQIFAQAPANQQTFLYMNGVSKQTVHSLMKFMYKGEVDVKRELLIEFMQAAQAFKIKGLADERFSFKSAHQQPVRNGAMQYQSSQVNRIEVPSTITTHPNQPATIHQPSSVKENRISLPAFAMSKGFGINPYAMKNINDDNRGYGLNKDYESDDDKANANNGKRLFANDGPNAKRPKLETIVNIPDMTPTSSSNHCKIADIRMNNLGAVCLFFDGIEFYQFGSMDGEYLWLCPQFESDKCQAAISTINVNGVPMMKVLTAEHSHGIQHN